MKQENDTPERIPGDPKGYDPVFDTPESGACRSCALLAVSGRPFPCAPCTEWLRPEGRGVHYVRRVTNRDRREQKVREALRLADELVCAARKRFPKSMRHPEKLHLELTCAAINAARLALGGQAG